MKNAYNKLKMQENLPRGRRSVVHNQMKINGSSRMQRSSNAACRDLNRVTCDKRCRNLRKRNCNTRFQWFLTAGKFPNLNHLSRSAFCIFHVSVCKTLTSPQYLNTLRVKIWKIRDGVYFLFSDRRYYVVQRIPVRFLGGLLGIGKFWLLIFSSAVIFESKS